jgi:flagellar motility protein MotE (MotC chaperone)
LVEEKVISIILEEIKVVNEDLKNLLNLKKAKYDKVLQSQKDVYQTL